MENLENTPKSFKYFEDKFRDKPELSLKELQEMKESGITLEKYLNYLHKTKGYLFHGSRNNISTGENISGDTIYASSKPEISILKALHRNNAKNLGYPMNIEDDGSNMKLVIDTPQNDTVGEKGFIYVLEGSDFKQDENSNWQYITNAETPFIQKIEVEYDDFKYPVEIV